MTGTECCSSTDACFRQSVWYSQCLPAARGCPAGWDCEPTYAAIFSTSSVPSSQVASVALRASGSISSSRLPTVVPVEQVGNELAPIDNNLSSQQKLENALAYVSALFNAQLAADLVDASKAAQQLSGFSLLLATLVSFSVGVLLTLGFWRLSLMCPRDLEAAAPSGTIHVGRNQLGRNQLNIVIDTSEGKVTGTRHNVVPPGAPECFPNTVIGSRYPSSRRSSVDPDGGDAVKGGKGIMKARVAPIRSHRASMEPMFGNIALAEPSLAEASIPNYVAAATPP